MKEFISTCSQYINIILITFSVSISIISVIYRIKSNFIGEITKFIKDAEKDTSLTSPEKMDLVVKWIKNLIPRIFIVVFNDATLKQIAQNVYDDMKEYRNTYIKNKTGLSTSSVIKIVEDTISAKSSVEIKEDDIVNKA